MKPLRLERASSISDVQIGFTWQSKPVRASLWRLLWFAMASSDWNQVHINPFTSRLFKSNLGGLTFCMDFVLAMTKSGLHKIFQFEEDVEVVARGYDSVTFRRPVRVGTEFIYRFILTEKNTVGQKPWCTWRFEVIDNARGETLCHGTWTGAFLPVERTSLGIAITRIPSSFVQALRVGLAGCAIVMTLLLGHAAYIRTTRPSYQEFLASLDPSARDLLLTCDEMLSREIRKTGNLKLQKKLGTFEAYEYISGDRGP